MNLSSPHPGKSWWFQSAKHGSVLLWGLLIFFIQGPRYVFHLADRFTEGGDGILTSWFLAWHAHALFARDLSVWDAPIFYPLKNALCFSENMLGNLWFTLPVQYVFNNPILTANMLLLASFVLATLCVYLLIYELTCNYWASLIGAVVFTFNPYRWSWVGHLQLMPIFWSALAILFANRFIASLRTRDFFAMLAAVWMQYYASIYLGIMLGTVLVIIFGIHILLERRGIDRLFYLTDRRLRKLIVVGLVLSVLILLPLGLPYLKSAKTWNFFRSLGDSMNFSAEPLSFVLSPSPAFRNYQWLAGKFQGLVRSGEGAVFIGFTPWLLAVSGLTALVLRKKAIADEHRIIMRRYFFVFLVLWLLTLGPYLILFNTHTKVPLPYTVFYHLFPGFKAIRVPARFIHLTLLALSIAGSFAVLIYWEASRRWPRALRVIPMIAFLGILAFDYALSPNNGVSVESKEASPPVYTYLAQSGNHGAVLELPLGIAGLPDRYGMVSKYLYYQTIYWRPLLGGMSGWFPPGPVMLSEALDRSPDAESLSLLELSPAATVVVHLNLYKPTDREAWANVDLGPYGFSFQGRYGDALVWERDGTSVRLTDKLIVIWAKVTNADSNELDLAVHLQPAKDGSHWRFFTKKSSDLSIILGFENGKEEQFQTVFDVPPYILKGNFVKKRIAGLKTVSQSSGEPKHIRFSGPLIEDCSLNLIAEFAEYHLGERIDFRDRGNSVLYTINGWSKQENWGTWTTGREAGLRLKIIDQIKDNSDLLLKTGIGAFVSAKYKMVELTVFANNQRIGLLELVDFAPKNFSFVIPREVLGDANKLKIVFRIDRPRSPKELNLSDDRRELGIGVSEITLVEQKSD